MNEFKIFQNEDFGEIRTIIDDNKTILFMGNDVAKFLGYSNISEALSRHCKYIVKRDIPHPQNKNKSLTVIFIPEPDVYRLITKSKLPSALDFENWLYSDVIPSIRKFGIYASKELLNDNEKLLEMETKLKAEKNATRLQEIKCTELTMKNEELFTHIKGLNNTIEEQKEKISYVQIIMGSDLDMTPTQIAADYGISALRLNNLLHEAGIQRKVNGQWVLYRKFMNCGYTNSYTGYVEQHDHYYVQTRWTGQGRLLIHKIMTEAGVKPICEVGG